MPARRPPFALRLMIGASLACGLAPVGFAFWSVRDWAARWRGVLMVERRADFGQVPWLRPPLPEMVAVIRERVGPGEGVLIEPVLDPDAAPWNGLAPPRWHVFLSHFAYPTPIFVRSPALSCVGFNQDVWLDDHFERLDLDGSSGGPRDELTPELLEANGVRWRLRIPVRGSDPRQFGLDRLEAGHWVAQPLPTPSSDLPPGFRPAGRRP